MAEFHLKSYRLNEAHNSHPAGHPNAIIPDEHGREQYLSARLKAESLLSKVEILETIISNLIDLELNTTNNLSNCNQEDSLKEDAMEKE